MKYLIITATLLGAGVLAVIALPEREQARPVQQIASAGDGAANDDLRMRALEHRVTDLNRRQSAMDEDLVHVRANLDEQAAAPEQAQQRSDELVPAESQAEQLERTIIQITDAMETSLEGEVRESAWASDTETEIADFLRDDAYQGVALESTECRSAMCRVEMRFADERALRHFVEEALNEHPWKYHAQMVPQTPDDALSVNLYIARHGRSLPLP